VVGVEGVLDLSSFCSCFCFRVCFGESGEAGGEYVCSSRGDSEPDGPVCSSFKFETRCKLELLLTALGINPARNPTTAPTPPRMLPR
jgi:hypothetical protein